MKLQQFKHLRHSNKTATIWKKGEHIGSRLEGIYSVTLWQVGAFYVEIYFDMLRKKITAFESFENLQLLDPYLAQVDISPLLA
jgi:hypothetical protein